MRAGIALGSNLGDRLAKLKAAREQLERLPNVRPPILASAVYDTEPVACEPNAPRFLNAVIELGYDGEPTDLLHDLKRIEAELGRPPDHERNRSRTLDLDLLYFGDVTTSGPQLKLPHPRMHERRFVLQPLHDIRPELVLPSQNENVAALLNRLPETPAVVRLGSEW